MIKKTLLPIFLALSFSACFSLPQFPSMPSFPSLEKINPFSSDEEKKSKKEIKIPDDAPKWLQEREIKNNIQAIGLSLIKKENPNKKELNFNKQKALISASQNLTKKIYSKTLKLYTNYVNNLDNPKVFEKDIKKTSEHIALSSLKKAKIKNLWLNKNEEIYVQIVVDSDIVATLIQNNSKILFKVDKNLYKEFLSNRAKKDIIINLEK